MESVRRDNETAVSNRSRTSLARRDVSPYDEFALKHWSGMRTGGQAPVTRHGTFVDGKDKRWQVNACDEHAEESATGPVSVDISDRVSLLRVPTRGTGIAQRLPFIYGGQAL